MVRVDPGESEILTPDLIRFFKGVVARDKKIAQQIVDSRMAIKLAKGALKRSREHYRNICDALYKHLLDDGEEVSSDNDERRNPSTEKVPGKSLKISYEQRIMSIVQPCGGAGANCERVEQIQTTIFERIR